MIEDTLFADDARHADADVADAVVVIKTRRDGEDASSVAHDGAAELCDDGGDREVGHALALDDLRARTDDIGDELFLIEGDAALFAIIVERHGGNVHRAPDGELALAVLARHKAVDVADIRGERRAQKIAETRAVEHGARTHDLACGKARLLLDDVSEHVHGVGNDDDDAAVIVLHDVLGDVARDADVLCGKVEARFAGLSAEPRGNDDDVAVLHVLIGAAVDVHRPHRDEAVADVHRLALGFRRVDVDDGKFGNEPLRCNGERRGRAHGAGADDTDLGMSAHSLLLPLKT